MSETKIKVPKGMLKAAKAAGRLADGFCANNLEICVESALRWLSDEIEKLDRHPNKLPWQAGYNTCLADIRHMFAAPDDPKQDFGEAWNTLTVEINKVGIPRAIDILRNQSPEAESDPLVMYIMRHFDDAEHDPRTLRNRAEAAVADYGEHVKRNNSDALIPPENLHPNPDGCPWCGSRNHRGDVCKAISDEEKCQRMNKNPETRNEIKDMLLDENIREADFSRPSRPFFNDAICEAFRRGKESKIT